MRTSVTLGIYRQRRRRQLVPKWAATAPYGENRSNAPSIADEAHSDDRSGDRLRLGRGCLGRRGYRQFLVAGRSGDLPGDRARRRLVDAEPGPAQLKKPLSMWVMPFNNSVAPVASVTSVSWPPLI